MSKNLYEQLGVNKNASFKEIKSAYRSLAMKNHPDRGGDEEIFKQIANAYHILSDTNRRLAYDQAGEDAIDSVGNVKFKIDPVSMFEKLFGKIESFFDESDDEELEENEIYEQLDENNEKETETNDDTGEVEGCGQVDDASQVDSSEVNSGEIDAGDDEDVVDEQVDAGDDKSELGNDSITDTINEIENFYNENINDSLFDEPQVLHISIEQACNGDVLERVDPNDENNIDYITIPKYTYTGSHLVSQQGEKYVIQVNEPDDYSIIGLDIIINKNIKLVDALTEVRVEFHHPNGSILHISNDNVISPNNNIRVLTGYGLKRDDDEVGDLRIQFNINFPKEVDKDKIRECFSASPLANSDIEYLKLENYTLFSSSSENNFEGNNDELPSCINQ